MTKFEEEALKEAKKSKVIANSYAGEFTASDIGLNIKLGRATHNFPWLEFAKNWHSDEEFQTKENELKRLRKLNHLYKKAKDNAERMAVNHGEDLNLAQDEISALKKQLVAREKQVMKLKEADKAQVKEIVQLKSQLQQQALPVVSKDVAEWIEILKSKGLKPLKNPETYGEAGFTEEKLQNIIFWISEHQEDYMRAWLNGYTVEKPQLFYLKNKLTGLYLACDAEGYLETGRTVAEKFTQQEIDSMQTGSYEQIEVTE